MINLRYVKCSLNSLNLCIVLSVYEQECHQIYRSVPDQECSTVYEQQCVDEPQTTYETTYEQSCQNVPRQVSSLVFWISVFQPSRYLQHVARFQCGDRPIIIIISSQILTVVATVMPLAQQLWQIWR